MKLKSLPSFAAGGSGQAASRAVIMATAIAALTGCASQVAVPQHRAMIDAKPEREKRDRISSIQLVSVNGSPSHGTQTALQPGRNKVRIRFEWPQGGAQEVDLAFHAKEGQRYFVHYDTMPPSVDRLIESTSLDQAGTDLSAGAAYAGEGFVFFLPTVFALWTAGAIQRGANQVAEQHKPARYVDLMVIAHHSSDGVVRTVRAYPDGRVDAAPWAAWAKMSP